jgi:hypothetical protein
MSLLITGADPADPGPAGCVARFMRASAAGDAVASLAELHPDAREGVSGAPHAPPGVAEAEVLTPEPGEDRVLVPTRLVGTDGTEQRFIFVVRPYEGGIGIDLGSSLEATLGGDPMQAMADALRTAVEPLGEALNQVGAAMGEAFGGDSSTTISVRRIAADADLPTSDAVLPECLIADVQELELRRRLRRPERAAEPELSTELSLRCTFDLDHAWTAQACTGVTLTAALSSAGEDLRPEDAPEDLGAESYSSWEREAHECYVRLNLAPPRQAWSGLAALSGRIRLAVSGGELLEVALGPVGDLVGQRTRIVAIGVELDVARDGDGYLTLQVPAGVFARIEDIAIIDAAGEPLNQSWSSSGDGESESRTYSSEISDDATLLLRFWSRSETVEIPFSAGGLPLHMP